MPQAQAYWPDGTPIAEAELPQALAEGAAGFEGEADVMVRDAKGRPEVVKGSDVGQYLAAGGSLETSASLASAETEAAKEAQLRSRRGPLEVALAAEEANLRGITFGGSDVLGRAILGPEYAESARQRQEANRLITMPAEIGGAVGSTILGTALTGPAGASAGAARFAGLGGRALQILSAPGRAVAGAGRLAEAAVGGGRIAGLAAQGAIEGGLYDAGMEMSKASLENREIVADKLLAAFGHGALMGGAGGAALGVGGTALSAAGRAALKGMGEGASLTQSLAGFAERRAVKSVVGNSKKFYDELTSFGAQPERVQRVGRKLLDRGIPLTNVDDGIKQVGAQLDDATARLKNVAAELDAAGATVDVKTLLSRVDDQIRALRDTPLGDFQTVASKVESQIAPLRRAAEGPVGVFKRSKTGELTPIEGKKFGFSDFWKIRQKLDDTIKWGAREGNPATDEIRALRRTFEDTLEETIEAQRPDLTPAWRGAKEDYRDFATIGDALEELATRGEKNRWTSPSDYWSGGLAFLSAIASGGTALPALAGGAATSIGHKLLREKGPGMVARVADAVAKVDRRLAAGVAAAVDGTPRKLKPKGGAGVFTAALTAEPGEQRFVTSKGKDAERLQLTLRHVREITADPKAAAERIGTATADFADWSPELAQALQQRVERGAEFLKLKMPQLMSRQNTSLTPQLEKVRVAPSELRKTMQYIEGLDAPESLLDDIANGRLPRAKIEAVKAVAPDLFQEIRGRVIRELSEREKPVPYNRRILLSLAFDFVGDKSLEPGYLARLQETSAATPPPEEQASGPGPDLNTESLTRGMETETQRLAGGA